MTRFLWAQIPRALARITMICLLLAYRPLLGFRVYPPDRINALILIVSKTGWRGNRISRVEYCSVLSGSEPESTRVLDGGSQTGFLGTNTATHYGDPHGTHLIKQLSPPTMHTPALHIYEEAVFPIIARPLFRRVCLAGKPRHYRLKFRDAEGELQKTAGPCGDVAVEGEIGRSDFDGVAL